MKRNLNRRQLNNEQKAELVRNHLKHLAEVVYRDTLHKGETVSWTTERIAKFLGLGKGLVRRIRDEMEAAAEVPTAAYVELEDGRHYPRQDLQDNAARLNEEQKTAGDDARASMISLTTPVCIPQPCESISATRNPRNGCGGFRVASPNPTNRSLQPCSIL